MSSCSIARTLEVVGEKWTILILREVWYGSSRFSDFERVLGCPRNLLAARLRMLVEEGILVTETYKEPGWRSRPKYVISQGHGSGAGRGGASAVGWPLPRRPGGTGGTGATPRMRRAGRRPDPLRRRSLCAGGGHRERPWPWFSYEAGRVRRATLAFAAPVIPQRSSRDQFGAPFGDLLS
ncbi:winged helix-turn-helix transcriptional regulator [Streptomyces mirabilis]|uniref:winged helix-turn-helix transcriptional regulator n=1 Tax=Streptomyces TaxID=1883 RepID=UPI0022557159|nr:helix-turn-helix domain-containing protein [Streptomyces sp. NBC_00268]MCX5188858.1 helix-turn-helix transcriptional regulator [Streptomyces sp. NBC_00268]